MVVWGGDNGLLSLEFMVGNDANRHVGHYGQQLYMIHFLLGGIGSCRGDEYGCVVSGIAVAQPSCGQVEDSHE